ncbi:MAG: dihydroxyacetone kinase phosphoryl donor subunit DhaM [Bacillota bacterium]|nr:dihydroxyacetone kinase phosphoryl donor subunit DhaM [Bacillota bacterium]
MVGMVVVSHSKKLAEGVVELCKSMVQKNIPIIAAGGTNDGRLGTDAVKIVDAIKSVNQSNGIAIFVDLGSAILSAELAIDMLSEDLAKQVKIIDAPLVEGCIASSIEISLESSLEKVENTAKGSYKLRKL